MTIKEKILKIMSLALEINPPEVEDAGQKRTAVFVSWIPHCSCLEFKIYKGKWDLYSAPDELCLIYTEKEDTSERLDKVIKMLEKIKEELCG